MKDRLHAIEERNKRVEKDKQWETSVTRRASIAVLTYITMLVFLTLINAPDPWLSAGVPAIAYVLSTLVLLPLRALWERWT